MPMTTDNEGFQLIQKYEGLKLEAYKCPAGVWTIGYGHTKGVKEGDRITKEDAKNLLREDLKIYEEAVNGLVKVPLNQAQFDALVSFCYNLGVASLSNSTLLRLLNEGKYMEASQEFLKWNKAKGKVLEGLTRRRKEECELFLSAQ